LLEDWLNARRSREYVNSKFLLDRFRKRDYITSFYEDNQDTAVPYTYVWVPDNEEYRSPAMYSTQHFMRTRYAIKEEWNPPCMFAASSNKVTEAIHGRLRVDRTSENFPYWPWITTSTNLLTSRYSVTLTHSSYLAELTRDDHIHLMRHLIN
jgi:hypothetical protein